MTHPCHNTHIIPFYSPECHYHPNHSHMVSLLAITSCQTTIIKIKVYQHSIYQNCRAVINMNNHKPHHNINTTSIQWYHGKLFWFQWKWHKMHTILYHHQLALHSHQTSSNPIPTPMLIINIAMQVDTTTAWHQTVIINHKTVTNTNNMSTNPLLSRSKQLLPQVTTPHITNKGPP